MRTLSLIALLALFFTACQNSNQSPADETAMAETEETAKQYTLTPFSPSAAFPNAKMESMTYNNGQFQFGVSNYELGAQTPDADQKMCANSGQGQHIHLIVDNAPYSAQYTADFAYDITDGEHYLLAFLSRSYHESVKNPAAGMAKKVAVANKSITNMSDIEAPMLFYSRPKGTYVGKQDTKKVMLDFYVVNAKLSSGYKVKADINGEEHMIDTWQPYYIEGLPMGENTITLTLVDGSGNAVDAPLNPVTRTFTLQSDPAEAQ